MRVWGTILVKFQVFCPTNIGPEQRFKGVSRRHAGRGHDPSQIYSIFSPKRGCTAALKGLRVNGKVGGENPVIAYTMIIIIINCITNQAWYPSDIQCGPSDIQCGVLV